MHVERSIHRNTLILLVLTLLVRLGLASTMTRPGYMDAAYYTAGAVQLAQGGGFSEPFVWNYLNDPATVAHTGFLYWMPLPSLIGAPFAALFPNSFFALQVPFAMLSALIPLAAYAMAWRATGSKRLSWAAGLLAVFSGFFFPYWTLPETFAPFALFGMLALWLAGDGSLARGRAHADATRWLFVGFLVGLAHLTRADGVLLLPVVLLSSLTSRQLGSTSNGGSSQDVSSTISDRRGVRRARTVHLAMVFLGYILVMGPWFARNLGVEGELLSPAGTKTIWLTNYDDLFCYECDLSPASYLAWGWGNILRSKLSALWINAQRFLAEDCLIFLLPFALMGLYRLRRYRPFMLASAYLVLIYITHSLVFTFPGWRGGFFHASSAALPFLYAAGMSGMDTAIRWATKQRAGWRYHEAQAVFAGAAVAATVMLSGYVSWQRIPAWRTADAVYEEVDSWLTNQGAIKAGVMVGNPPAFWYHTERPTVVVPNGDVETLLTVADRYEMSYVLVEQSHPVPLADLHAGIASHPRLQAMRTWSGGEDILYAVQR